jgi:hypothetical protein
MVELELVGLSEDGTQLVLADAAGNEFAVPLDGRLRAVVRGDRVRHGQLETSMESAQAQSALRPRDIQARIRAGETPEAVAEIAQVPVDKIMGYAVPVMAERQHMVERAQRSAVRRKNVDGPALQLWDAVAVRLRSRRVDPQSCQWDAWRREDGRWTVTACYRGEDGERTGSFVFDALSRYAVAADDDARWLVGERDDDHPAEAGRDTERRDTERRDSDRRDSGHQGGRRLSAVASEYDAMLFDDEEPTTELTAVADVLGDHTVEQTEEHTGEAAPAAEPGPEPEPPDAEEQRPKQQPRPEKRGRRGRGRASVPSWDEIMFGQPKG